MKLKRAVSEYEQLAKRECQLFKCPGCDEWHMVVTKADKEPVWGYNGNPDRPTFTPSLLLRREGYCCHSFITDGKIQFLNDCTHKLKGQTVELPEISEND